MWTSRLAWVVVVPAAIVAFTLRNSEVSSWWDVLLIPLLSGLVLVPIAPELARRAVRATRPAPEPAPVAA